MSVLCVSGDVIYFSLQAEEKVRNIPFTSSLPRMRNQNCATILYRELGIPEDAELHNLLQNVAVNGKIDYVLHHHVQVCNLHIETNRNQSKPSIQIFENSRQITFSKRYEEISDSQYHCTVFCCVTGPRYHQSPPFVCIPGLSLIHI